MATFPPKHAPDQRVSLGLTITTETDGLSDVGDCGGLAVAGIEMSTAWTSADLAFRVASRSSADMRELYVGAASSIPTILRWATTALRTIGSDIDVFEAHRFVQLVSISTGSSTGLAQAVARTVNLLLAPAGPIK